MSGKGNPQAQDPPTDSAATEGSTKPGHTGVASQRSITPKGTLFTNLGEAHQAITSRLASRSRSPGNRVPNTFAQPSSSASDDVSDCTSSSMGPSGARHMEFAEPSRSAHQQCPTFFDMSGPAGGLGTSLTPTDPSPVVSSLALSSSKSDNPIKGNLDSDATKALACSDALEAESTEDSIYEHYSPFSMVEPCSSAQPRQGIANGDAHPSEEYWYYSKAGSRGGTGPSSGIRQADAYTDSEKNRQQMSVPVSTWHQTSLPEFPRACHAMKQSLTGSSNNYNSGSLCSAESLDSSSCSQELLGVSNNDSDASGCESTRAVWATPDHQDPWLDGNNNSQRSFASHRRLPHREAYKTLQDHLEDGETSHGGVSNSGLSAGGTTDSDEDPFKYDRGPFTVFLHPSKEREVSAALRCVSGNSTASAMGVVEPVPSREPATPQPVESKKPFLNKRQPPIVDYDWDTDSKHNEVKVSIRSPPLPPNAPVPPVIGLGRLDQNPDSERRKDDAQTLTSDGADWETVATSLVHYDNNRDQTSSSRFWETHPAKVTGSSIADYSDTSSIKTRQCDVRSSIEQIPQPPRAIYAPRSRFGRTLEDVGAPVFLPRPRIHRVNGYLPNPNRIFSDPTTSSIGNSTTGASAGEPSASMRPQSDRKLAQRQNQHLNAEEEPDSRFRSLDSLSSTNNGQSSATNGNQALSSFSRDRNQLGERKPGWDQQLHENNEDMLPSPMPHESSAGVGQQGHNLTGSDQFDNSFGPKSATLFSFPLISLEEAARREALKSRDPDSCTPTSGGGTQKNSSMLSKAPQMTTPPALPAAHSRRRTISMAQDRQSTGYDTGTSNRTSDQSTTPLVTGGSAMSRSFRNPFGTAHTSLRNNQALPTQPSIFDSPRLIAHDRRGASRGISLAETAREFASFHAGAAPSGHHATEDGHLPREARQRRQIWYYVMCCLSILPFVAPLVYCGVLDAALSWCTRGEATRLSPKQRGRILFLGLSALIFWLCIVGAVTAVAWINNAHG